jgi:DNA replication protein DnaC
MSSLAELMLKDLPRHELVPGSSSWTDEQWAEHDAKIAARRAEHEREEAERDRLHRLDRLERAGWPKRALEAAAAADETKPALARVVAWKPTSECVLVLSGAPGCGKTTAAAHWAIRRWPTPAFLRATTFAASSRYDHERRSAWLDAEALVLDDLGSEYADTKGNFLVDLDELVDTFYGDKRPLVITTNCTDAVFKSRYGQRIVDRIRECGSWFSVNSTSLRRKAG